MKINIETYKSIYHSQNKFYDLWQEGIKLLPFTSNPSSAFDHRCGLHGITGEFYRRWYNDGSKPIDNFEKSVIEPISLYLSQEKDMPKEQIDTFIDMIKDILYVNGSLNITDSSFLKYIPLMPDDERMSLKDRKKYSDGQRKIAKYLYSMLDDVVENNTESSCNNLFLRILKEGLTNDSIPSDEEPIKEYTTLPFIKESFNEDLKWMLKQEENVKVKYMHIFLYFYACYSVTQIIANLSPSKKFKIENPIPFYFILNSEKASENHDAVVSGWSHNITKDALDKLYGRSQALDMVNVLLGGNVGFYYEVLEKLNETPFEENRELCEELITNLLQDKREMFNNRNSEKASIDDMDTNVESYEMFLNKIYLICTGLQTPTYISRMRKKVVDLLSVRFLQRRRGNFVLTLDNEMLIFLIALFTKSKKVKLDTMYKLFNNYGIFFNRGSRMAIENYLLKLNLLDRKSDSGEAQYVTVIL